MPSLSASHVADIVGIGHRRSPRLHHRGRELPEQRLTESPAHEEVDDGVQADVERGQEEGPFLHLEEQETAVLAEDHARGLADCVGDAADVVRHKAEEEHQQDAEDAAVGLPVRLAVLPPHTSVGLVHSPGDGGVAEAQQQEGGPEDAHAQVGGGLVPPHAQRRLQAHAVPGALLVRLPAGQEGVGQQREHHQAPGERGERLGDGHVLQESRDGGWGAGSAHNLHVALQADEAQEHDAHVHAGVEEHGRVAAHHHMEAPSAQLQHRRHPPRVGQQHQEVSHHHVLQIHHQPRAAGHPQEDPGSQQVQNQTCRTNEAVQHRQDHVRERAAEVSPVGAGSGDVSRVHVH